jgi:CRISPR-associated endoribonuclease Cas2 subtype I-E
MLLLVLENAPSKLRGYCSSWALQVAAGVYVANLPARTRKEIWAQVNQWADLETRAILVWGDSGSEQGLDFLSLGAPRRFLTRREGLILSRWLPLGEGLSF